MIIAPQAEPGGATRSGLKFFFCLNARAYGGDIFVAFTQAEPGGAVRSGLKFFCLNARAYGGDIFIASTQAEPGGAVRSGLKFFFALTPAPAAGFLQLPLRLGLRRRRLRLQI